ncbi:MAG: phospholipase [Lysobacteraceae bacterium]|nr:MAG: phospholipase [Xanthomonadaceae bacterium]
MPAAPPSRRIVRYLLLALLACYLASAAYQLRKPLPDGISAVHPLRHAGNVGLLTDVTYVGADGASRSDQQVFDEVLRLVGQAKRLVVMDMFLFNDFAGADAAPPLRPLSAQLTRALVERKLAVPGLQVLLITDPINTLYGGMASAHLDTLRAAGVEVVVTDLARLRAPNPAWSGAWQLCCRWAGNDERDGWLPSPFGAGKTTLRSYLALLNLNANHRKTLVVDVGDDWAALVASANPHDGSSAHSNVALRVEGDVALDLLESEKAVVAMSAGRWPRGLPAPAPVSPQPAAGTRAQLLTESRIRDALLASLATARPGDQVDVAVFYLSHRGLVRALVAARKRGVVLRVLLDPNRDAFGRLKNGIPNRQAALELHQAGVPVRWCDTHGEQCHAKFLLRRSVDRESELIVGSANYTRRNLDDYNLESSLRVVAPGDATVSVQAARYFEQAWSNGDGRRISLPYAAFEDRSRWRYWRYRFTEATGLSSF